MSSRPSSMHGRIAPLSSSLSSSSNQDSATSGPAASVPQQGSRANRSRFYFPESTSSLVSPNLPATAAFEQPTHHAYQQHTTSTVSSDGRRDSHGQGHRDIPHPFYQYGGQSLTASLPPSTHPSPRGLPSTDNRPGTGSYHHGQGLGGLRRRSSRASMAALTQALQTYRIPSPSNDHPGPAYAHSNPGNNSGPHTPPNQTGYLRNAAFADAGGVGMDTEPATPTTDHPVYGPVYGLAEAPVIHPREYLQAQQYGARPVVNPIQHGMLVSRSNSGDVRSRVGQGLPSEMMDALVDIHRVLYRGKEDLRSEGKCLGWEDQGREVRRVVERWFEGDCIYDHPLSRISSRESLLTHFILLHLVSSGSVPSLSPSGVLQHTKSIVNAIHSQIRPGGKSYNESASLIKGKVQEKVGSQIEPPRYEAGEKGKGREQDLAAGLGYGSLFYPDEQSRQMMHTSEKPPLQGALIPHSSNSTGVAQPENAGRGWWKLWDVSADCKEIGGMECYDGYHMAIIEHVITLTLLPAIAAPRTTTGFLSQASSFSSLDLAFPATPIPSQQTSFVRRLAGAFAREFDYLLKWDLPINTVVEFNEVGKATRIRDIVDVQDVIETFVPGAKRFGWLTRRISGYVSSKLGSAIVGLLPRGQIEAIPGLHITAATSMGDKEKEALALSLRDAPALGQPQHPDPNFDVSSISTIPPPRSDLPSQDDLSLTETNLAAFNQHAPTINPIRPENLIPLEPTAQSLPHSRSTTEESNHQSYIGGTSSIRHHAQAYSLGAARGGGGIGGRGPIANRPGGTGGGRHNSLGLAGLGGGDVMGHSFAAGPGMAPDCDEPGYDH